MGDGPPDGCDGPSFLCASAKVRIRCTALRVIANVDILAGNLTMVGALHEFAGELSRAADASVFRERHLHRFDKSAIFMKQNVYIRVRPSRIQSSDPIALFSISKLQQ